MSIERSVKVNGAKYFSYLKDGEWKNDPLKQQSMFTRTFLPENTQVKQFDNVSDMVTEITEGSDIDVPPIPEVGTWIEKGILYQDDENVYRVRQAHNVTIYDPDDIPALFTLYRKETTDMEWVRGEEVDVGVQRTYEGKTYECLQAHQTQLGWEPATTLALWKEYEEPGAEYQVWVQPTGAHDAYPIDAIVWYPNENDVLWISKINANVTVPDGDEPYNRYWEPYTP